MPCRQRWCDAWVPPADRGDGGPSRHRADSYDRFFPNQDTLPQGGFGNLIALPLQKRARDQGNSVFVDDDFVPWPDQWAFLCECATGQPSQAEALAQDAERRGRILGVRLPPEDDDPNHGRRVPRDGDEPPLSGVVPTSLELSSQRDLHRQGGLSPRLRNRLVRLAAFQNPEFYKAQAMRLPTYDKPRIIACAEDHPHHIGLPRGCIDDVDQTLTDLSIRPPSVTNERRVRPLKRHLSRELRPEQKAAADALAGTIRCTGGDYGVRQDSRRGLS